MRIFYQSYKPKLFYFGLFLFFCFNYNYSFAQNLSLNDLSDLQKKGKSGINKFLTKNNWKKDAKVKNSWIYGKSMISDSAEAMLVLRDFNCTENILYYFMSDTLKYKELKSVALKNSTDHKIFDSQNTIVEDYKLNDLYIRFYESHIENQLPLYALWIFSNIDGLYFAELNTLCFHSTDKNYSEDSILVKNENNPDFPGGGDQMNIYLHNNFRYPIDAREAGIYGTVHASFVVEKDGKISEIKIIKGIGGGCDEEVIKLIKNMPRWTPGTQNNKPVRVQFNMPVNFILQ
jgi:TonB family protein